MGISIIDSKISRKEAMEVGKEWYPEMVKGVVDIERGILALGGEYHMDANTILIERGSLQRNVWGFNIYPERTGDWIEFTSLINIRPKDGNRAMVIQDEKLKHLIRGIIERLIV